MPPVGRGRHAAAPKRRKKKAPSKVQLSHAQARQYGSPSQSRRAARTNRREYHPPPAKRPIAFRPIRQDNAPFRVQRQRQRRTAERADKKIGDNRHIPHFPLLRHYTPTQRRIIQRTYKRAAKRAGVRNPIELYALGSTRQRREMTQVSQRIRESEAQDFGPTRSRRPSLTMELKAGPEHKGLLGQAAGGLATILGTGSAAQLAATHGRIQNMPDATKTIQAGALTAINVTRATAEDPTKVAKTSLRTARESIAGIPQGIKMMADDPVGALEQMAADYERRYGSVLKNPAKFREMVKNDYGITPYALDAMAFAGGAGQAAGAVSRTSAFGRLAQLPGAAGRAARVLHEATTAERPRLRFSAGERGTRAQETSRNLFVALGQRRLDRSRAARYRGAVHKAGYEQRPGGRLATLPGREVQPDRLPGLRPGDREVLGSGLRELPGLRAFTGRVARDIGQTKSTSRLAMLTHRGRVMRKVDKAISRLSEDEKLAVPVMLRFGIKPGEKGVAALVKRLKSIDTEDLAKLRDEYGFDDEEVRILRQIIKDPERYLTADAREVANELRDIQIGEAANDPSLDPTVEATRRLAAQAELLGVPRRADADAQRAVHEVRDTGKVPPERPPERPPVSAEHLPPVRRGYVRLFRGEGVHKWTGEEWADAPNRGPSQGRWFTEDLGRAVHYAKRAEAGGGFVKYIDVPADVAHAARVADGERSTFVLPDEWAKVAQEVRKGDAEATRAEAAWREHEGSRAAEVSARRKAARKKLMGGENPPDTAGMERLHDMLTDSAEQQRLMSQYDLGREGKTVHLQQMANDLRRKIDDIKAGKDVDHVEGPDWREAPDETFQARVRKAAEEAGLDEPAYWMSTADQESGARLAAVGSGTEATERNRQASGGLFRIGAERQGLDVFQQGVERNIKRRFQWQMVARNIETHAFEWSYNKGNGASFAEIANEMRRRRIDPDTVDFVPASIVKRRDTAEEGLARGDVVPPEKEFADVHDAIRKSTGGEEGRKTFEQLANDEVHSAAMFKYFAVPKQVGEVLEATTAARKGIYTALEIVLKQKPTRIMLGALNIPWLGFQVASNALLTGLGGGFKPWDVYGAMKWFNGLDPDARNAIEAELGITHGHHFALDQPHMGDSKLPPGIKHLSDFHRAYKRTKVGRAAHKANPLDFMFKMDEAQNNFFRKVLFYSKAKKSAYNRMGRNWRAIDEAQGNIIERIFKLPPDEQMQAVAQHADLFEKHADHVREWLGDYTRFSNAERRVLSANVLFYGYLRFSLRFAFYTMPVRHPIMLNILANIGRLGAQEIKDIFGVPSNYALPTSALAQVYYGDRQDAKRGNLQSVNWGRMNPFLNTVTQIEQEQQAIGLVSPLYQALADQSFEESSFTGREWRIEGMPTPAESQRPPDYFGSFLDLANPGAYSFPGHEGRPRNRILQRSLLSMAFPYRVATETGIPGVVDPIPASSSDDSLLWSQHPFHYKEEEAAAGVAKARRKQRNTPISSLLLQQLLPPVAPRPTALPAVIKRRREQEAENAARRKNKGRSTKRRRKSYSGGYSGYSSYSGGYGG